MPELFVFVAPATLDEPDYGSKEKLKSIKQVTKELVTGEAQYLQSLQCIVEVSHTHQHCWRVFITSYLLGIHTGLGPAISACIFD